MNARGEPLLPADLLRNYIFLRAARQSYSQEDLYKQYWVEFDEPFWRAEVRQGRISRPRSDLYIQHFLSSRQAREIPIKHLYVEYKFWIERKKPFENIQEELETLNSQGSEYRRLLEAEGSDAIGRLAAFLRVFDMSTVYPLLLYMLDQDIEAGEWQSIAASLESYILRRAVMSLPTKNYTRIFLQAIRVLETEGATGKAVKTFLSGLAGEGSYWPGDDDFRQTWATAHVYQALQNARVVYILRELSMSFQNSKTESISISGPLTVEHILPQNWIENWPLMDGSQGVPHSELWNADPDDDRVKATRQRSGLLQTFGNLTILTQALNSSVSNSAWSNKREELMRWSLLPINLQLHGLQVWNEDGIRERGNRLLQKAIEIWPGPSREG